MGGGGLDFRDNYRGHGQKKVGKHWFINKGIQEICQAQFRKFLKV